jgi:hypothetical protein
MDSLTLTVEMRVDRGDQTDEIADSLLAVATLIREGQLSGGLRRPNGTPEGDDYTHFSVKGTPLVSIRFSAEDVRAFAEEAKVPFHLAMERAAYWANVIEQRITEIASEQLLAVVRDGQP